MYNVHYLQTSALLASFQDFSIPHPNMYSYTPEVGEVFLKLDGVDPACDTRSTDDVFLATKEPTTCLVL